MAARFFHRFPSTSRQVPSPEVCEEKEYEVGEVNSGEKKGHLLLWQERVEVERRLEGCAHVARFSAVEVVPVFQARLEELRNHHPMFDGPEEVGRSST